MRHLSDSLPDTNQTRCIRSMLAFAVIAMITAVTTFADAPGRGRTANFEVNYLRFIINHHASALRSTELAAGTDVTRDPGLPPAEGTSPTPTFPTTSAKATLPEIFSMARAANRMQREEILSAQRMLRQWYGIEHAPTLPPEGLRLIQLLEATPPGREFDRTFLMAFSWHHYMALRPSVDCQIDRELTHDDLDRYCRGIVHNQINEITEMRKLLCKEFGMCDFQPSDLPQ